MIKRMMLLLLALTLCMGTGTAEESIDILGLPFPDFSTEDTQGDVFTLSEALKDHEAVLINIWATWCPPCRAEFTHLNEAYQEYRDRVAFISLSCEDNDTMEIIEAFREAYGLSLPMGRDEGAELYAYMRGEGIPTTLIVDRFGNAVYKRVNLFTSAAEIGRVLDVFLGDTYTESVVLYAAPKEQSTGIFPVFAERTVCFDNENVRRISFYAKDDPEPLTSYVISDDIAHLRFELSAYDNPASMVLYVPTAGIIREFHDLLDAERNVYTIDLPIPQEQDRYFYTVVYVADFDTEDDPNAIEIYLLPDDDAIEKMVQELLNAGNEGVTWKEEDLKPLEPASFQAYLFHVVDQYGAPVQEVYVNFCTDTACSLCVSDENGIISFRGQPEAYHVQMLDVPEGYSFDEDFEFYVGPAYGEWMLRIRKN